MKSKSQQKIERFMGLAKQDVPDSPTLPDEKTRKLRAALILEECLETVGALGFAVLTDNPYEKQVGMDTVFLEHVFEPSLVEIADGCADIHVVTTGTLSACGIKDEPLHDLVDNNNLAKFGEGHSFREDGKLIKPPNHQPPDIKAELERQSEVK